MKIKRLLLALLLGSFLLAMPLTMTAQDAEPAAEETSTVPGGVSTLMFLLGVGAIIIVGGAMLARDNFKSESSE